MSKFHKKNSPVEIIPYGEEFNGGAWKVAYADFVTAMMAFFLLLWLLNVTTDEQKNAISNYFDPTHPKVSTAESGAGGVLGGMTMSPEGAMASDRNPTIPPTSQHTFSPELQPEENAEEVDVDEEQVAEVLRQMEEDRFEDAKKSIEQAINENPDLKELSEHLLVDMTPEGLRIQILDQEGSSMFPLGSARMFEKTKKVIEKITGIVKAMPNKLSIRGHTDGVPFKSAAKPDYTNWELSTDRANSSRRVMLESGLEKNRIYNVQGKADTDLLIKENPKDAQNRRISIVLMKEELTGGFKELNGKSSKKRSRKKANTPQKIDTPDYKKSSGSVEFP